MVTFTYGGLIEVSVLNGDCIITSQKLCVIYLSFNSCMGSYMPPCTCRHLPVDTWAICNSNKCGSISLIYFTLHKCKEDIRIQIPKTHENWLGLSLSVVFVSLRREEGVCCGEQYNLRIKCSVFTVCCQLHCMCVESELLWGVSYTQASTCFSVIYLLFCLLSPFFWWLSYLKGSPGRFCFQW